MSKNQELANELNNPTTRKLRRRKVYSSYRDNISDSDLANMELTKK